MNVWKKFGSNEILAEEDANDYVLDQIGLTISPKGKNGTCTSKQLDWIEAIKEIYLADGWQFIENYDVGE